MKWFRFYSEVLNDPKVQQLPPLLFKHWINLLCLASSSEPRGILPNVESVAFALRTSVSQATKILRKLEDAGLLDRAEDGRYQPHNWSNRQYESDDVAPRVARHRERKAQAMETLQHAACNVSETPPETETEFRSDAEAEQTIGAGAPRARKARAQSFSTPEVILDAFYSEMGVDDGGLPPSFRSKQTLAAKAIIADGLTADDVVGCLRYLQSQMWRTAPVDLGTVHRDMGKWVAAGRPRTAAPSKGGGTQKNTLSAAEIIDLSERLPLSNTLGRIG